MKVDIQTLEDELGKGRHLRMVIEFHEDIDGNPVVDYSVDEVLSERTSYVCADCALESVADALKALQGAL